MADADKQPGSEEFTTEQAQEKQESEEAVFPSLRLGEAWGESITKRRADELEARFQTWEQDADHGERKGPFDGTGRSPNESARLYLPLTGADVFWLAARALAGRSEAQIVAEHMGRLRRAHHSVWILAGIDLSTLNLSGAHLDDANLSGAILIRANLSGATLVHADLSGAILIEATFSGANLVRANLSEANLQGATLSGVNLGKTNLSGADLHGATLTGAHLSTVHLNVDTDLSEIIFSSTTVLADVIWNDAPLAQIAWESLQVVGDETEACKRQYSNGKKKDAAIRLNEYRAAVRAYRLLTVALRNQGLNEHADRYAYRAQLMQRVVLRRQAFLREKSNRIRLGEQLRKLATYLGSGLLDLIAGYGYRPGRSILAYVVIILFFAALYLVNGQFAAPHLHWDEALVLSISSFHGRGFFTSGVSLGDTLARLAAGEAVIGLLLEITFIATFTQRFFAR